MPKIRASAMHGGQRFTEVLRSLELFQKAVTALTTKGIVTAEAVDRMVLYCTS